MIDRESAMQQLGLVADAAPTRLELKRAYLRRLREHPPERDPDGFRALREAYELLDGTVGGDDQASAPSTITELVSAPTSEPDTAPQDLGDRARAILEALVRDDIPAARRVAVADEHRVHDGGDARMWARARELLAIAAVPPTALVQSIARAIIADDPYLARHELEALRDRPAHGRDLMAFIAHRAPSVYAFVGPVRPRFPISDRPVADRRALLLVAAIIGLFVIRAVLVASNSDTSAPSSPTRLDQIDLSGNLGASIFLDAAALRDDPRATDAQREAARTIASRASCEVMLRALPELRGGPVTLAEATAALETKVRKYCEHR